MSFCIKLLPAIAIAALVLSKLLEVASHFKTMFPE